ncbi:TPA: nucleoside triphosphate pyrophosphohydrolase family protein [Bacillus thuringiensis]|nr:nucleoside triphosphate pyrophosphohydrolase family protein [Bacillus thuringiensis]
MELRIIGSFTFDDFDLSVRRTWKKQDFKDAVSNAALGLTGEAGEVADLIKKAVYHGRGFQPSGCDLPDNGEVDPEDVKDELSDVLFYVSAMAQEFGFTLEEVAKHNREKLEKRFPEGFSTEASAQKKDKAPGVKPIGEIRIGYSKYHKEDTLEYVRVDKAPFSATYFSTDYELKKTLKELRDGSRVTIEDKHKGEFKFTKVGNLIRVHFKDLEGNLDSHTCLVKVSYEEVKN